MMSWTEARLGEVTRVVGGSTPSTSEPGNFGGDIVWVTPMDLGRLERPTIDNSERAITSAARRTGGIELLPPGTVVMSSRAPIGHVGVAGRSLTTNQGCKSFVPGPQLDSWFLYYALRRHMDAIRSLGAGATFAEVSKSDLEEFTIRFPNIEEQRRIAGELSSALEMVRRAKATTEIRKGEAGRLVERSLAYRIGTNPTAEWVERRLGDVVQIQLGKMLSPASKTGVRSVPYLRNANVQWDRFDLTDLYEMDFSEAEENKFRLKAGDVLVCEGGQPGRAAIWAGEIERCCYQKSLHRLRPTGNLVDPQFLMYRLWLGTLRGEFVDNQAATTIAHLPAVRLASVRILLPRLTEQRRLAAALQKELAVISSLQTLIAAQSAAINELPAALIRRAIA